MVQELKKQSEDKADAANEARERKRAWLKEKAAATKDAGERKLAW